MNFEWETDDPLSIPTIEANPEESGIRIWDPIDKASFVFRTPSPVSLRPGETDDFLVPIDSAVEFRTDRLDIPCGAMFHVWDDTGTVLESIHLDEGEWKSPQSVSFLEVTNAPIRLYIAIGRPVTIRTDGVSASVRMADEAVVRLGIRSYHESPRDRLRLRTTSKT